MQKITPFLWFNNDAEEAANFYVSIFPNSKIRTVSRYEEAGAAVSGRAAGSVQIVSFEINGQRFDALNGGPMFSFTPAISFLVECDTQEEIDHYWEKLTEGGSIQQCGWLSDKYGVTWQIAPRILDELVSGPDTARNTRVMKAMLGMVKLDIAALEKAAAGE